jgi:hypothetical protein
VAKYIHNEFTTWLKELKSDINVSNPTNSHMVIILT